MEQFGALSANVQAMSPELSISCLFAEYDGEPTWKARYEMSAWYWFFQPFFCLVIVTLFAIFVLVFQRWFFKQLDRLQAWWGRILTRLAKKMEKMREAGMVGL